MAKGISNTNVLSCPYVDEVNKLRELVKVDHNGQKALETLFAWFIAMTKEQNKFMFNNDSFLFNWLANFIGSDRFMLTGLATNSYILFLSHMTVVITITTVLFMGCI